MGCKCWQRAQSPSCCWRHRHVVFGIFFLLVSAGHFVSTGTPIPSYGEGGQFAVGALRALLSGWNSASSRCSVAIIADHSATGTAVVQGSRERYTEGGAALLLLPSSLNTKDEARNNSGIVDHLKDLVKAARKLRILSDCFTVVLASDSNYVLKNMLEQSTEGRLLVWTTHALVVTNQAESVVVPMLEGNWAFTMMNSLLLLLRPNTAGHSAKVLRHEPYSPVGRRTRLVSYYTPERGLSLTTPLEFVKCDNFYGAAVNYSTLPFAPHWAETEETLPDGSKKSIFSGTEYEALMSYSEKLNFTATLLRPDNWGQVEEDIENRKAFMSSMLYFVLAHRLERYDYIHPYTITDVRFTMKKPTLDSGWDSFLRPFFMDVWLYTLAILFVVPVSLILLLKYSNVENVKSSKLRGGASKIGASYKITVSRAMLEVFGALLGQDFTIRMPHTHSFRILLTSWFLYIIVLSTGYKSNLIAFMTSPLLPTRAETLTELIESNAIVTAPSWGKAQKEALSKSNNREHQILSSRYHLVDSTLGGMNMALTEGTAHVEEKVYLTYTLADNFVRPDGSCDLYLSKEGVIGFIMSWPIPHDAPFKPQLDRIALNIAQAALPVKWTANEYEKLRIAKVLEVKNDPKAGIDSVARSSGVQPLTLYQLQGPFWIMVCGSGMSMVYFSLEMLSAKAKNKWGRKSGEE